MASTAHKIVALNVGNTEFIMEFTEETCPKTFHELCKLAIEHKEVILERTLPKPSKLILADIYPDIYRVSYNICISGMFIGDSAVFYYNINGENDKDGNKKVDIRLLDGTYKSVSSDNIAAQRLLIAISNFFDNLPSIYRENSSSPVFKGKYRCRSTISTSGDRCLSFIDWDGMCDFHKAQNKLLELYPKSGKCVLCNNAAQLDGFCIRCLIR